MHMMYSVGNTEATYLLYNCYVFDYSLLAIPSQ